MVERGTGDAESLITIGSVAELHAATTRRGFLRLVGLGATLAFLPSFVSGCKSDSPTGTTNGQPGGGEPLLIDFAIGDAAILQFAYVLEQLEADFYSRVVASFATSNILATEQTLLTDISRYETVKAKPEETSRAVTRNEQPTEKPVFVEGLFGELSRLDPARPRPPLEAFFADTKRATIHGYYTSEIGIHKELRYKGNQILAEFVGCQTQDGKDCPYCGQKA